MEKFIKKILTKYDLTDRDNVLNFINNNPENLSINDLSRIAEIVNNERIETAAYYTDFKTLNIIEEYLPNINKEKIKILEPSAGIGNFLDILIKKYGNAKELIIDLNDIDKKSIEIIKSLNQYRNIPQNVKINFYNADYLSSSFSNDYDLIIGNPPFLKLSKKNGLNKYSNIFNDQTTKNLSGFFLQKSLNLSDNVIMIMPKYFLHNEDFSLTRKRINEYSIEKIIDFGEKGFKGVLIETIAIFINKNQEINETISYSVTNDFTNIQKQKNITESIFPSWIIYRDEFFDNIVSKFEFSIFKVFRDRQITNKKLNENGDIRVIKSRNISRDGEKIKNIPNYDAYINFKDLENLSVRKFLNRDDVYLCPNMTYYPRLIKKPKNVVVNGSVAILKNVSEYELSEDDIKFFSSPTFEKFYRIARNYSTRSLNIDKNSVKFFGIHKKN